jgi:hypothetical protein
VAHPATQARSTFLGLVCQQRQKHLGLQCDKGQWVAEEAGDVDQQFPEEHMQLGWLLLQEARIDLGVLDALLGHATLDAAGQRALLVLRKVVAGGRAQQHQDPDQSARRR